MSGYNRLEQTVGTLLNRFPRAKHIAESAYQRTNYHLFGRGFDYDLHADAQLFSIEEWFDHESSLKSPRFVGFYDIQPWNESMDWYLAHELISASNRAGIVALGDDSTEHIATTDAWNYQQGSRAQWHPSHEETIMFNDCENGSLIARAVTLDGKPIETYPRPIAAMHPQRAEFLSVSYQRLDRNSPAYGYDTVEGSTPEASDSPESDGIFSVNGNGSSLLVSFASLLAQLDNPVPIEYHYLHHLLYAPDGEQFVFLHRWMDGSQRHTRLYVADHGGLLELLLEDQYISHFCWLDAERLFLWGRTVEHGKGYYIIDVPTGTVEYMDALTGYGDGHPSVSPDGQWIATDTYPDRSRKRHLMLYNLETDRIIQLGSFIAPFEFDGANRCDLHPRWSPDGQLVSIDSAHEGTRRSYVVDVSKII